MWQIAWKIHDGTVFRLPMDRYDTKEHAESEMAKIKKIGVPHWIEEAV